MFSQSSPFPGDPGPSKLHSVFIAPTGQEKLGHSLSAADLKPNERAAVWKRRWEGGNGGGQSRFTAPDKQNAKGKGAEMENFQSWGERYRGGRAPREER